MRNSICKRTLSFMLLLCLLSLTVLGATSCASRVESAPETEITNVSLNQSGDTVTVSATLSAEDASVYKSTTLCLFVLEPFEQEAVIEAGLKEPLTESHGSETMRFSVDFFFDNGMRNRLCQRFVLAQRDENGVYSVLTDAVYLSNPEALASGSGTSAPSALKGLSISVDEDVSSMTPAHTVVEIAVEDYLCIAPIKGDTVTYTYAGATLSLRRRAVEALDEQIKALAAQGCAVYLRPMLKTSPDALEELSVIGYEGSPEAKAYELNLDNENGYFYLAGFFSFLASRYANVTGVIPGYALNDDAYVGTTAESFDEHMENTLTLMRVLYNTFRSVNSTVEVALPVSNLYTTDGVLGLIERGAREFLGAFASYAKTSGDFDWSVYICMKNPTPGCETVYTETGTVNHESVTEKYILPQTVSLLLEQLASEEMRYKGAQRDMIWGLSVSGAGDEENQRLSLLYTYGKALVHNKERTSGTSTVLAVIWEMLTDSEGNATGLIASDGREKPVGGLFSVLGRGDLSTVISLASAEARLGTRYSEISSVLSGGGENVTVYTGADVGSTAIPEKMSSTLLYGDKGTWTSAFRVLPGSGVVTSYRPAYDRAPMLRATFTDAVGCGVYTDLLLGADLKDHDLLALTLTAALPEGVSSARVRITLSSNEAGKTLRYEGIGTITDGNWSTMAFDLSAFAEDAADGSAVTLTVALMGVNATEEAPVSLYVSRVEVYESGNWFLRGGWILILVIVVLLVLVIVAIWLFRTYDIRWVPNPERASKSPRTAKRRNLFAAIGGFLSKLRPRSRARSRIMVKPDAHASGADPSTYADAKARHAEFDGDDSFDAEEAEELFDADPVEDENEIVTEIHEVGKAAKPMASQGNKTATAAILSRTEPPAMSTEIKKPEEAEEIKVIEEIEEIEEIKVIEEIEEIKEIEVIEEIEEIKEIEVIEEIKEHADNRKDSES